MIRFLQLLMVPGTLVSLAGGCGPSQPILSHGKPVSHWLAELKSKQPTARKQAVLALGHVGTADPDVFPALTAVVEDKDVQVRRQAILSLLNLGPAVGEAVPALEKATKDRDAKVRDYAGKAINRIQGQ